MEDNYEKIEDYLNGKMSSEEKLLFEAALTSNQELATAFAVYRTIETEMRAHEKARVPESALKDTLQTLNTRYFKPKPPQTAKIIPFYANRFYKITAAIAASIIILVSCFIFWQREQSPQRLAGHYIQTNLLELSQTMDASQDSLQLGIAAYNNQEYRKALPYFQAVYTTHPDNSDAKKYMGLVYLVTKDYNQALRQFEELANLKNLYSNPGLFLQAITLMQRNQEGDQQKAKQLLQQVVNEKAAGSREAEEWLPKL